LADETSYPTTPHWQTLYWY